MMSKKNQFIVNTAKDYDMSYGEVKSFYDKYGSSLLLYERLEEFIKTRALI